MPYHTEHSAGDLLGPGSLERTRSPLFAPVAAGAGTSIGERYNRLLEQTKMRQGTLASLASARQSEISLEKGGRELEALRAESDVLDELDAIPYWDKDLANKLAPFQELATYNPQIERALNAKASRGGNFRSNLNAFTKSAIAAGIRDTAEGDNLTDQIKDARKLLRRGKTTEFLKRMEMNNYNASLLEDSREVAKQVELSRRKAEITSGVADLKEANDAQKALPKEKAYFPKYIADNKAYESWFDFGSPTEDFKVFAVKISSVEGDDKEGTVGNVSADGDVKIKSTLVPMDPMEAMALDVVRESFKGYIRDNDAVESYAQEVLATAKDEAGEAAFEAVKQGENQSDDDFKVAQEDARQKAENATTIESLIKDGTLAKNMVLKKSGGSLDLDISNIQRVLNNDDAKKILQGKGEEISSAKVSEVALKDWYDLVAATALDSVSGVQGREAFIARFTKGNQQMFLDQLEDTIERLSKKAPKGAQAMILKLFYDDLAQFVTGEGGGRVSAMLGAIHDTITRVREKDGQHKSNMLNPHYIRRNLPNIRNSSADAIRYWKETDPEGFERAMKQQEQRGADAGESEGRTTTRSDIINAAKK
tara:strand:- start:11267 stop:13051 length:1785 start_codon:yes stop_codon:yes gene_type:complete